MTDHPSTTYPDLYERYPDLYHEYPEVAMHIYRKIEQHSEAWVLENWYTEFLPAGVLMDVPEKKELPFFNPEEHESWSDERKAEMARAYSDYRQNLKDASSDTDTESH